MVGGRCGTAFAFLIIAIARPLCEAHAPERREKLGLTGPFGQAGAHVEGLEVQLEDDSFNPDYLEALREGVLNASQQGPGAALAGAAQARHYHFSNAFASAYTFFFTATRDGLPFASRVLGLPLDEFLVKAIDPKCNAFFLNAVVLPTAGGQAAGAALPWHDFAINFHVDQSLRPYARDVPLPNDGTARTVVVLYLSDVPAGGGGELEVYPHFADAEPTYRAAGEQAQVGCQGKPSADRAACEAKISDRVLENITLGRVAPRRGRIVQFKGFLSHAVRKLADAGGGSGSPPLRVSLVLEQFDYSLQALDRIPTVWSESKGEPFFADAELENFFVENSKPRWFGTIAS